MTAASVASGVAVTAGVVGLVILAVGATGGTSPGRFVPARHALGASVVALLGAFALGFGVALVGWLLAIWGPQEAAATVGAAVSRPLSALFVLQLLVLALVALVDRARSVVEGWFRDDVPVDSWHLVESLPLTYEPLPFAYWASLPFQGLLAAIPWGNASLEWVLSSLWLFGTALEVLLTSGFLVGLVALVAVVPLAVLVAEGVRRVADAVLQPVPARRAALGAGGVLLAVLVPVVVVAATVTDLGSLRVDHAPRTAVLALGGLALAIGALYVLVAGVFASVLALGGRRPDVVGGSGLVLLATVAAAAADAPPLVIFAGVAATVAAWDLGSTAGDLGDHVGRDTESRRAEVVHATGTLGVGVVGVGLATAAIYLLGPLATSAEQAGAAALLALAGLLVLAGALTLDAVG
ncbi:hypothetical protein BRC81_10170 [Halobacteriales archaeon QS_1_68_20]|nr:MAG: hypothetical protein BRC81_10170 [Halobacteriales archaeon QS_1_68_20]